MHEEKESNREVKEEGFRAGWNFEGSVNSWKIDDECSAGDNSE